MSTHLFLMVLMFVTGANADSKSRAELQIAAQNASEVWAKTTGEAKKSAQEKAIRAHILWGDSEESAGDRDRAIAAFASGVVASPVTISKSTDSLSVLAREALQKLNRSLRDGLPLFATDDVLGIIAARAQGNLWQPRRANWQLPNLSLNNTSTQKREFFVTSGKLFAPPTKAKDGSAQLWRVPPMYQNVNAQTLPRALKLDRVTYGYTREYSGANTGLWRQTARVFYASAYQTQGVRDDRIRAEILCQQFLKIAALLEEVAGVKNRYASDGVTSIYLSELPAEWPNAAPKDGWNAGAWLDSSPGDFTFFRIAHARGEAEWLRQLSHEYSHLAMPPFGPFAPPLETWGNGNFGETLALLWAASDAKTFAPESDDASASPAVFQASLLRHVTQNALPGLQIFAAQGPHSGLKNQFSPQSLEYSQGLGTFIERAYGPKILAASLQALSKFRVAPEQKPKLASESLLQSFTVAVNSAIKTERVPIYLGAVLRPEKTASPDAEGISADAAKLVGRAAQELKNGQKRSGWIYIPASAKTLNIEGEKMENLQIEGWKPVIMSTQRAQVFDVSTRSGWQKIKVVAVGDVTIRAAWVEK